MLKVGLHLWISAIGHDPRFGWPGVLIRQRDEGVLLHLLQCGLLIGAEVVGITQWPAVGAKVNDELKILRANGALWIRRLTSACSLHVPFATGEVCIALRIHPAVLAGFQHIPQTARRHAGGYFGLPGLEKGRRQVGQADEVIYDAAALHPGAGNGEADAGAEVIQVAFAMRKSRRAVIAADDDQRVVVFASLFQFLNKNAQRRIEGGNFAEVICQIFTYRMHIRQERRHLAFQVIRINTPQFFTGPLGPFAMHIGWSEPIRKRLPLFAILQELTEVSPNFTVQFLLGFFHRT